MTEDETALAAEKVAARIASGKIRAKAFEQDGDQAARAMTETCLRFAGIAEGAIVSGFYPYRTEIDLRPLLSRLSSEGYRTCLPIVEGIGTPLTFKCWVPGETTMPGAWDIPIPLATAAEVEPDVILVPLLAFDRQGFRLGYGGGFYDRTIEKLRRAKPVKTIGIAFSAQEVANVARGPYDQPLDWVLTENGPIEFRGKGTKPACG